MLIGLDFDNTIVSYDTLFYKVAIEQNLIPLDLAINKIAVRDYLRSVDKEILWTEMQGYVYGARMNEAEAYPGLFEALNILLASGHELFIVSHKTKYPFVGKKYDLHTAASNWISENLQIATQILIKNENIFFELTKEKKIERIAALNCDVFIDDLPEILLADQFPTKTLKVLFDPEGYHLESSQLFNNTTNSWQKIPLWINSLK
jgi:hypothetical protein